MAEILTVETLLAISEKTVALPGLSKDLGREVAITVRRISGPEYVQCNPDRPPEAEGWPDKGPERAAAAKAWFESLSPAQQEERRRAARDVLYRVVEIASLRPKLTLEQARRLGDDAAVVANEVLRLSGLLEPERPGPIRLEEKRDGTLTLAVESIVVLERPATEAAAGHIVTLEPGVYQVGPAAAAA
jgi:hypothetical protein